MKLTTFLIIVLFSIVLIPLSYAQVGVMNTDPKSIFDIEASNAANPANTDGILIPRIQTFPATDPGVDQDGMLVFLATASGNYKKGLHHWDDAANQWTPFGGEWIDGYNGSLDDLVYAKQANANGVDVVFLNNGSLGIGTDDPEESLEIKLEGTNAIQISSASPPNAPNIIYYTRNGSFTSSNFLNDDEPLGGITGKVWAGTGKSADVANINSIADGNHSSGNLPTKFNFSVTGSGDDSDDDNGIEMTIKATGNIGIGTETPTAVLHLKAGTAVANTAPLKLNAGINLTTPEAGAFEYDGTHLYFTPNASRIILLKGLTNTATLNFPNITTNNSRELTVPVIGAALGSSCNCAPAGSIENGLKWSCFVSSANTVTVRLSNITAGNINPVSKSWKVTVIE